METSPSSRPESAERRQAPRRQPAFGTVCQLTSSTGADLGQGLVWNISVSGVSMLLHHRLDPGTTVRAELHGLQRGTRLPMQLLVRHVSQMQTGDYVLGGQFERRLSTDEMQPFLG